MKEYADFALKVAGLDEYIPSTRRFYRGSCLMTNEGFVKDLRIVQDDMSKVLILDNTPYAFSLQPRNGLSIPTWTGAKKDKALVAC